MINKERLQEVKHKILDSPRAKQVQKIGRKVLIALIIAIIIWQLFDIGWGEVLQSLPTQPLFYLIFLVLYITLPVAEIFIYRQIWQIKRWKLFKAFLTKRVYNDEVMGYSGEFFLFMWSRKYLSRSDKEILKNIRDNNILSALSSNTVTILLLGGLLFTGILDLDDLFGTVEWIYVVGGLFITAILIAVIIQFRRYLFNLPFRKAVIIGSIYFSRFLFHNALMIVLWAVAIPGTPLTSWLIFIAVMIVVNRIPFMPSRDLVFMVAGIELSRMMDMTPASVAGMLLVYSVLKKILNLILFLLISAYSKDPIPEKVPDERV